MLVEKNMSTNEIIEVTVQWEEFKHVNRKIYERKSGTGKGSNFAKAFLAIGLSEDEINCF